VAGVAGKGLSLRAWHQRGFLGAREFQGEREFIGWRSSG